MDLVQQIQALKKEKQVLILAHYYTLPEVQEIADVVGDSYYLSKVGMEATEQKILFCGVRFMAESAKLLSPDKVVWMPDTAADCPMAHMVSAEKIAEVRAAYEDVAVVCYVNSTAQIKALSDVCVTSSNAVQIIEKLPHKHIFFIPDQHLGRFVSWQVPDKHFILNEGYCPIHHGLTAERVREAKACHEGAVVMAHPECQEEVLEIADYVGSTLGIIQQVKASEAEAFLICTEEGILHELTQENPSKHFYQVEKPLCCADMKRITLQNIYQTLKEEPMSITLEDVDCESAKHALEMMHTLGM